MKRISITLFALTGYLIVVACKTAFLGPDYPITDFSEYDYVVVATVDKAVHYEHGYRGLNAFSITINECFKGDLEIGDQINGKAKDEVARAVCPVWLDENSDYLLLLTKSGDEYQLSRFSFPVKKGYKYFDDYISQIEKSLNKNQIEKEEH